MTDFDERLNKILKEWFTPFVESAGFQKNGLVYHASLGVNLSWLIDIQRSRWNDNVEASFTLNCGVYIPGIVSTYLEREEPKNKKLVDCCVSARIGMLSSETIDKWWMLNVIDKPNVIDKRIGEEIIDKVSRDIIPFLSMFREPHAVAEFLSTPQSDVFQHVSPRSTAKRLAYAAIIYHAFDEPRLSREMLEKALATANNTPIQSIIHKLRERI